MKSGLSSPTRGAVAWLTRTHDRGKTFDFGARVLDRDTRGDEMLDDMFERSALDEHPLGFVAEAIRIESVGLLFLDDEPIDESVRGVGEVEAPVFGDAGLGQVYLVHMGNGLDYRELVDELPDWATPAYDGLEL